MYQDDKPLTPTSYQAMYEASVQSPQDFWAAQATFLDWDKPFKSVGTWDFQNAYIRWFDGGRLNACYNCIDRHLPAKKDKVAFYWEGDEPGNTRAITYQTLYERVCQIANALKAMGVQKGDRVCLYLPMIPEALMCMLACARIGAVHSVIFGGFSPQALAGRIQDAQASLVITADEGRRGGKTIPLKANVDAALAQVPCVKQVLVIRHTQAEIPWCGLRDVDFHTLVDRQSQHCVPVSMDAEDPLFILYTSGSTGAPKGVCHTTGGYLLYAMRTFRYAFDIQPDDVYWCTADIGWITGHSYMVYGPLAQGVSSVIFEGVPHYPDYDRFWRVAEKYRVSVFYTAPTAIRALMAQGNQYPKTADLSALRMLGTVGEPINPEAWRWYHEHIGGGRCPIVDTWWQTETGGILIAPWPNVVDAKPGAAGLPFFGIEPAIVDSQGRPVSTGEEGALVIKQAWPGQMRTVYGDHQRFQKTYFSTFAGLYLTGDSAKCDADAHYWVVGRMDDVMNVSGHRLATAEIESALVLHPDISEAAVVGVPDAVTGQAICAYVVPNEGVKQDKVLSKTLTNWVAEHIGKLAKPKHLKLVSALPKTRSGKIMRRILRKIAEGHADNLGDLSTLADPTVIETLIPQEKEKMTMS